MESHLTNLTRTQRGQPVMGFLIDADAKGTNNDISLMEIWRVIRGRKAAVLSCLAVAIAFGVIYCILAPRRYEATTRVVINGENSNPLGIAMADMPIPMQDISLVQETQVRVLQSDTVAWDVIQQLRLDRRREFAQKDASSLDSLDGVTPVFRQHLLAAFHQRLKVRSLPKTQIVDVSFRSVDPKLAADVVNAVAKAYVERNFRTRFNSTTQASDWLARQLDDLKAKVESKQDEFIEFQKKTGIVGTDETHSIIISRLDEFNKDLATAQADRIVREARYRQALGAGPDVIMELAPSTASQILRGQEAELNSELARLTAKYGNSYPKVMQLRTQLAQLNTALEAETKNVRDRLETEYLTSARAEHMASAEVERQKQEANSLNEASIHYLILKRELEGSRDLYEDLQKKLKEAGIVAGLKSTNVNVVDAAEIPVSPSEPRVPLTLTLTTFLGGICGIGLAFGMENLDTTIRDPKAAESLVELPVLGVVPHMSFPRRKTRGTLDLTEANRALHEPQSGFAESFRILRSTLLISTAGKPPQVVVVTSPLPGEGKTVTATNVALAFAQTGKRVLLVDGDMRRGPIETRLNLPPSEGLSRCIAGAIEAGEAVVPHPEMPNFDILPAGERPAAPAELLDSDRMRQLIIEWRKKYDHIVIDTPPVLGLSDALVLATMADVVLLVARYGVTGRQSLSRARDSLERVDVRPLGLVFNDLDINSGRYHDYFGYYGRRYSRYYGEKTLQNGAD
jgi:succinoglycan biosynthesis transport protein ExoP